MSDKRQKMLQVFRHERDDIIPMAIELDPYAKKKYAEKMGGKSAGDFFDLWYRYVELDEAAAKQDFDYSKYYSTLTPGAYIDMWGTAKYENEKEAVRHYYPMQSFTETAQIDDYAFPDFSRPECCKGLREQVNLLHDRGLLAVGITTRVVFPICWHLRGMQEFLMDLLLRPEFAEHLLDRVTECQLDIVRAHVSAGVDVLWVGGDVATQITTMMSPDMWARWIKPRLKYLFDEAKKMNPEMIFAFHCCGAVMPIVQHLVDVGLDILNPVQPECIDLHKLKDVFGRSLTFWGGVSIQRTLPLGTPDEVRAEVRERTGLLGRGGGYVVCGAHHLTSDVPWDNVLALADEAKKYSLGDER